MVGRHDLALVDGSRPTDAVPDKGVAAEPDRTLPVIVTYPALGDPGDPPTLREEWDEEGDPEGRNAIVGAEPVDRSFPLLVFAHGWMGRGASLVPLAERWARAGYLVALPTFPLSKAPIGFSDDDVNQPADISFVIDELLAVDDGPLAGLVDGEHIALGGHSLGAATVFRAVYSGCCTDERIDATIAVAGGPKDATDDTYQDQPDVPMLLAHGTADPGVPVGITDGMIDFIDAPVTYLRITDGDHTDVFVGDRGAAEHRGPRLPGRGAHQPNALAGLDEVVAESGLAELRSG